MISITRKIVLFVCISLSFGACRSKEEATKPNIVYILTDQWRGAALGYAGDPNVKTPELNQFAQEAINFTNAVSVCPVCTPHRAALLTGRYPTSTGMFVNDICLPSEELCMAEIFKDNGYNTAYLGKWHLDGHGRLNNVIPERRQGFDYWKALECSHNYTKMAYYENDDPNMKYWEGYSPMALATDANQYISQHAADESPFLLFISIGTPHYPHGSAPQKFKAMYPKDELILAPNVSAEMEERARQELQGYYGHCTATDKAVGKVLAQLKALDLMDNTIVVFTSDHGEMMGAHGVKPFVKQLFWDESIKVPFLIHHPSIEEHKGTVINAPINTPDILPSLLGLAGIDIPKSIEGEDLSVLITKPDASVDRAALVMGVSPFGANFKDSEYRALRTKQYTYVRTPKGASQFYDNIKDPYQMDNLLNKPEFAEIQKDLDRQLDEKLAAIQDDLKERDYYMDKWHLKFDAKRRAINYWGNEDGEVTVQSPRLDE